MVMSGVEIQIGDSHKIYPKLEGKRIESKKEFGLKFGENITIMCLIDFEHNNQNIRIKDIKVTDVDKNVGTKVSININTKSSFHDGKAAIRLTFNLSSSGIFSTEVGSCILKLTTHDTLIQYSKTENVSIIARMRTFESALPGGLMNLYFI